MTKGVLFLSRADVEGLLSFGEAVDVVEKAFTDDAEGRALVFPVVREALKDRDGVFGIKSGYMRSTGHLGLKAGGFWGQRVSKGLPGHQSAIILFSPDDGSPICLMDANYITEARTAAAGAIAARHLARPDSKNVAIIGTGVQGRAQLTGLLEVYEIGDVSCYDISDASSQKYAAEMRAKGIDVKAVPTAEAAVKGADIIVTATPSREPIVRDQWILPRVHVNAMGADTKGKQELEENILTRAKIVVDNLSQCLELGECQHAFSKGMISESDIHAELGEITSGKKPGRERDDEITLFDATGVTFQDLATAGLVYERAKSEGIGQVLLQ